MRPIVLYTVVAIIDEIGRPSEGQEGQTKRRKRKLHGGQLGAN